MAPFNANNVAGLESSDCGNDCSLNISGSRNFTEDLIQSMIPQVLQGHWENLSFPLTEWQKSQLEDLEEPGVTCLLRMWLLNQQYLEEGSYCNATWDNVYCWPPTANGNDISRECSEIVSEMKDPYSSQIQGTAFRVCLENGTWLMGNWTNYTECADSYDEYTLKSEEERKLVRAVQILLFVGAILSFVCLTGALSIFYYFRCLWCDRVAVHVHLMAALMLRCALLVAITEPFIFNRTNHYRNNDVTCKMVLSMNLYAAVASINWMFIQGVHLHRRLTTNIIDKGTPFKTYYAIGWIFPMGLIGVYAVVMEMFHPVKCWKDYGERPELWILLAPIFFALFANFLLLINILKILLTTEQQRSLSEIARIRRAIKATFVLFPLLGTNNLLFFYNPGGEYNKYFVILNTLCGSTQGIFVAVFYCFVNKEVRKAIYREYLRFLSRRSANEIQNRNPPRANLRSRISTESRPLSESSDGRNADTSMIEMVPIIKVTATSTTNSPVKDCTCSCSRKLRGIKRCNPWKLRERDSSNRFHVHISATHFRIIDGR